ncbi:MAG: hypothetical protein CFE25_11400 [Chitinophagaceae bacterium BSSC1]|nr:MAG: hypothetical protein CFE25_11400 [Chitinophagaceae bacterium BSSC1]
MQRKINWLHFTDLHYGQDSQNILWPKIKKELFKDLEFIKSEIGKIDIVFFSGDLTQSGKKEEFDELTALLKELWSHFATLGSEPYLVAIPGNHDLTRPDRTKAAAKVLISYQSDEEFKTLFWDTIDKKSEYIELINQCFKNFTDWYKNVDLPKLPMKDGILPGDFSIDTELNEIQLKIVGLNTAFLELSSGDFLGKLAIHPRQLIQLTSQSPLDWIENSDLSILMTHHDPSWYDEQTNQYYNNDINPAPTFYNHLCGHLHKANSSRSGLIGSESRRIQLAPSLFGLKKYNNDLDRIHGYFAGSFEIIEDMLYEKFYPRIGQLNYGGNYRIVQDSGFDLHYKPYIQLNQLLHKTSDQSTIIPSNEINSGNVLKERDTNILDLEANAEGDKNLNKIPKINYPELSQHKHIRIVEQQNFIDQLTNKQIAWLITDWGLDEQGFIGSILCKLHPIDQRDGFILDCEDIISEKELLSAFEEQFGMLLQNFCNLTSTLTNSLLVLNYLDANLYLGNAAYYRFMQLVQSIVDFCPQMKIIIVARKAPSNLLQNEFIKLSALDISEIRAYTKSHPSATNDFQKSDNLLKVEEITSGLPKHIDRLIENLKVVSFEELIETEKYITYETVNVEQIPKSLRQAIASLLDSTDKTKNRSLDLLKVLTILANGETIGNLTRFFGVKPIYIENANLLEKLSLIDVITTTKLISTINGQQSQQIKILKVPRQIRDYVTTLITDSEKDEIVKAGCDLYFGNKWRTGVIRNIYGSLFTSSKFLNVDNCHLITNSLMANAVKNNDDFEIERAANLSIKFCSLLYEHGDYRNAIRTSEEIYNWLKSTDFNQLKAANAGLYGKALRMTSQRDKSTEILKEALLIENAHISNNDKNSILAVLGYSAISNKNNEKAIEYAKEIEKTALPKSTSSLQAKYILTRATLSGDKLISRLKKLENEARKADATVLRNNILLSLADLETDSNDEEKRLNKIIESKDDEYNVIRAVIRKSLKLIETNKPFNVEELNLVNIAYSYLYSQRLEGLFNECHKVLWSYCIRGDRYSDLLNLFKHSSLVWRISDDLTNEKRYFLELLELPENKLKQIDPIPINLANIEYYKRRKLEFGSTN